MGVKNRSAKKIHASRGWCAMHAAHTKFVGVAFSVLEILLAFKLGQISLLDHRLLI